MNLSKKNILVNLERAFVLSPFFLIFAIVFNVPDSKHLFSRLVLLVAAYCALRYRYVWPYDCLNKSKIAIVGIVIISYFFLMQFLNDGNSDLPRSMLYILVYFIFLPTDYINTVFCFRIISLGGFFSGLSAIYGVFILGFERAGYIASNPIPFSFYSGACFLASGFLFYLIWKKGRCSRLDYMLFMLSAVLSMTAVILTQTRATFLSVFMVVCLLASFLLTRKPSFKRLLSIIMFFIVLFTAFGSVPDVRDRVFDAWEQIEKYSDDNYQSSTGIRIKLWISGVDIFSERAFLGNSKEDVQSIVESRITTGVFPEFLKPFLVHPNPNFHNQFIQSLVDSGLVGLMLVCLLVSAPYLLVIKSNCIGLRLFGISISLFVVICLSFDSLFLYNQTVILFCALLIMMFGCCKDVLREEE